MKTSSLTKAALALVLIAASAGAALAGRPAAGHGGFFADGLTSLNFEWTDFDDDFLQAFWEPSSPDDFARETPDGMRFVHASDSDVAIFAIVGGVPYHGHASYQNSFFADCTVFDPSIPAFNCFIGPGSATMDARGSVTNDFTGEECRLSAHLAAFFVNQQACEAIGFPASSCVGGALVSANRRQFDIAVDCGK